MVNYETLYRDFIAESRHLLDQAEAAVLEWEQGRGPACVDLIFRAIHTIKGNSGLFDRPEVSSFAHSFEHLLGQYRTKQVEATQDRVDLLLDGVDGMRRTIESSEFDSAELLKRLKAAIESQTPARASVGAPNAAQESSTHTGNVTEASVQQSQTPQEGNAAGNGNGAHAGYASQNGNAESNGRSNGSAAGGIRIPGRLVKLARAQDATLAAVFLDLLGQDFSDLQTAWRTIQALRNEGRVLLCGPQADKMSADGEALPYFMVVLTNDDPARLLKARGLRPRSIKTLHSRTALAPKDLSADSLPPVPAPTEVAEPGPTATAEIAQPVAHVDETESGVARSADSHLRVPVSLIDRLMNLAGETIVARNDLLQRISSVGNPGLHLSGNRISQLVTSLQENIMRSRLQELDTVFQRLPRIVRDVASATGKKVRLSVSGGDVELDKNVIDVLLEAITHMVRNAIDHGLETPAQREQLGKKPEGTLRLNAELRAGAVLLEISDDGRGLDLDRIRKTAQTRGLIEADADLSADEIINLIFLPGFSTASSITTTSGRGVGMDVVQTSLKRIGGSLEVSSKVGQGTSFVARIPQTLSIVTCLVIESAEHRYAISQQNVVELLQVDPSLLAHSEEHLVYNLRNQLLPVFPIVEMLHPDEGKHSLRHLAVLKSDRFRYGVLFERVLSPEELLVKPLGGHFQGLGLFAGAAIVGSGQAVLVLDVTGLAKLAELSPNADDLTRTQDIGPTTARQRYLLVRFGGQLLALPADEIPRVEPVNASDLSTSAGVAHFIYEGRVVRIVSPDLYFEGTPNESKTNFVILYQWEGQRIGIAAEEVLNVVSESREESGGFASRYFQGHFLYQGKTALVLNTAEVLATESQKLKAGAERSHS